MPLTEEEKQALREKYRKQRKAMWEGKPQSRESQDGAESEQRTIASDNNGSELPAGTADVAPDAQESTGAEGNMVGTPSATPSGPPTPYDAQNHQYRTEVEEPPSRIDNVTVEVIAPAESPEPPDSTASEERAIPHTETQSDAVEVDSASVEGTIEPQSQSTARVQLSKDGVTTYVKPSESPKTGADGPQTGKQIREQRQKMWEEQPSSRTPEETQQQKAEPEEQQPSPPVNDEKASNILNWKLVLGVVGMIIALTGVGILLGYWFAS